MLTRLQGAMGRNDSIEQMVLLPGPALPAVDIAQSTKSVNLVVGYNRTPSSQTALDVTLWIAHQTRLATDKVVTVHVVYVVDEKQIGKSPDCLNSTYLTRQRRGSLALELEAASEPGLATHVLTQSKYETLTANPRVTSLEPSYFPAIFYSNQQFEQADHILWQARCLAKEWGGSFKAHLRFGRVAEELRKVVESENAALLFLGCDSAAHPIVRELDSNFPCPVLGIPTTLNSPSH
jgi:nucleotide-binding universal stress UspA family protein